MHCFPHTGCPSTNRILPTGQDLPHIPQEIQPSSTWKLLVPMTKRTNKGFTTYVFSQAALPSCTFQTLFRAMTSSAIEATACRAFSIFLRQSAPSSQIEHRYVGIGHCNRPGSIQRNVPPGGSFPFPYRPRMYTRHNGNSSPATGAATKKSIKTRGAYHECTGKTIPSLSAVDSPAGIEPCLRQSTMLTAVSCIASASNSAIQREFPVAVK